METYFLRKLAEVLSKFVDCKIVPQPESSPTDSSPMDTPHWTLPLPGYSPTRLFYDKDFFDQIFPNHNVLFQFTFASPVVKKTSTTCLKDVLPRQVRHLAKTSYRCPKDVLIANLKDIFRHLEETLPRYIVDVLQNTS